MNRNNKLSRFEKSLNQIYNLLVENKDIQILPILHQYRDVLVNCDEKKKDIYNRFMAFGYLRERNLIEAENYIGKLCESETLDVFYIMTTINFHLREFEKAIKYGNNFLEEYNKVTRKEEQVTYTNWYKNNILNFIGQSLMMLRRFDEADDLFNYAIQVDPKQPQTYINMIRLAEYLKDEATATEILETALQKCPDSNELKILAGFNRKHQDNSYSHT